MAAARAVYWEGGALHAGASELSPQQVLLKHGAGAYTTALLLPGGLLVDWARHRERLARNLELLHAGRPSRPFARLLAELEAQGTSVHSFVDEFVAPAMKTALAAYYTPGEGGQTADPGAEHAMLLVCIAPPADEAAAPGTVDAPEAAPAAAAGGSGLPCTIAVMCKAANMLPYGPEHAVQAAVMGRPRSIAGAKASSWVAERRRYEEAKPPEAAEVLLSDADGRILEGITTNFSVITVANDPDANRPVATLHTCGPRSGEALGGVTQQRLLEAAEALGMRMVLQAPAAAARGEWSEAFVSNCLRRVQPLRGVFCPPGNAWGTAPWEVELPHAAGPHTTALLRKMEELEQRTHWRDL